MYIVICENCKEEYEISFNTFKYSKKNKICPKCRGRINGSSKNGAWDENKLNDYFISKDRDFISLENNIIKYKCVCGSIVDMNSQHFKTNKARLSLLCNTCSKEKRKYVKEGKTKEKILAKLDEFEDEMVSGFIDYKDGIIVLKCPKCNEIYEALWCNAKKRKSLGLLYCKKCSMEANGINQHEKYLDTFKNIDEYKDYQAYVRLARSKTNQTYNKYKKEINPNNRNIGKKTNHIDHIFSVYEGFRENVPIEIISSKENLQILEAKENWKKNKKCDITKHELMEKYGRK